MVEETLHIAEFFSRESCGQCPACRMETNMLAAMLKKVQQGQGGEPLLEQFSKVIGFNKGKGFLNHALPFGDKADASSWKTCRISSSRG